VEASLERLQTPYIDLYQIHRWDKVASSHLLKKKNLSCQPTPPFVQDTPIEETMEALHDLVKAGKVRYIGASSMYAWQFAKAQHFAQSRGWTPFVSMQNLYNLLYRFDRGFSKGSPFNNIINAYIPSREEEREMIPLCLDQGVGGIPWSPLARGKLTPKDVSSVRSTTDLGPKM